MWAVCDLFASVPSYYDNTRCGGARRIRVLSESAHVIMCVPHARVRTCDFVHIRMRECACMIMCVPHMRNVLYETALRALRERPAGRFAPRDCAHQNRMRAYDACLLGFIPKPANVRIKPGCAPTLNLHHHMIQSDETQ